MGQEDSKAPWVNRPSWIKELHAKLTDLFPFIHTTVEAINQHEDRMLLWIIGLSGGAIALFLQLGSTLIPGQSHWTTFLMILPWVCSAFAGIVARLGMSRLLRGDREVFARRFGDLYLLPQKKNLSDEQFTKELVDLFVGKMEDSFSARERRVKLQMRRVEFWSQLSQVLFALAIPWLVAFALFALSRDAQALTDLIYFRPPG